jgi:aryl-alcohol dehydrogenase-like predicted oxidoreductase
MKDEILEAVQNLRPIADSHGLTISQLAIAWVLQNENVAAAIMGATKPSQVKENVKASGVKLSSDAMSAIDRVLGTLPERDATLDRTPRPRA